MRMTTMALAGALFLSGGMASADEVTPDWSFSQVAVHKQAMEKTEALFAWAEAEYTEHENEGLFEQYPDDGKTIKATLNLAKEFKANAAKAFAAGDKVNANALLFAAEATAFYATKMPHLLEKRVTLQTQVSNQ